MGRPKKTDVSPEVRAKIIYKAQTDLFFLGKHILCRDLVEGTHKAVCEFFVKKDPSFKNFEDFARSYQGPRDRLLLLPRATYKSSIKIMDNVQWFICWPKVRLFTFTATKPLATSFINELQSYFVVKGQSERNPETNLVEGGEPTKFHNLFPHLAITEKELRDGKLFLPHQGKSENPAAGSLSIDSTSSGWHCDLMDLDDVISDDNAESGNLLEKLGGRIAMVRELLMNYGFRHIVGTRYHPLDPYGILAEQSGIQELYGDATTPDLAYMCRPCWWLKGSERFKQPDYKTWEPREEDVDLFFPEGAPFKDLRKKLKNPQTFYSQQLNDPIEASGVVFTEELVRSRMVDHTQLPRQGKTFIRWDLAYGTKRGRDYRVGAVGLLDEQGRWWITAIIRGLFDFNELPFQIVNGIRIHHPERVAIEDSQGAKWMTNDLDRRAKEMGVELNIDWVTVENTEDAKAIRMLTLHPLMVEGRIFILNSIECMDDLLKEFRNVGNKNSRNDIPDAISGLTTGYGGAAQFNSLPTPAEDAQMWREIRDKDFSNMIFCRGAYEPLDAPVTVEPEPETDYFTDPYTGLPSGNPF